MGTGWSSNLTKPFCLESLKESQLPSEAEKQWWFYLMSLFRNQVQENETMEWYSDYIDKRSQTGLNPVNLFPSREGQTDKGRAYFSIH